MTGARLATAAGRHAATRAAQRYGVRLDERAYARLCDQIARGEHARLICRCAPDLHADREAWLVLHAPHGWMVAIYNRAARLILTFLPLSTQFTARGVPYWDRARYPDGVILEPVDAPGSSNP